MNDVASRIFKKLEGLRTLEQVQDESIMSLSKEKAHLKSRIRHLELQTIMNAARDDPKSPQLVQEIKDLIFNRNLYKETEKQLDLSQKQYNDTSRKIESCRFWYNYADTDDIKKQN